MLWFWPDLVPQPRTPRWNIGARARSRCRAPRARTLDNRAGETVGTVERLTTIVEGPTPWRTTSRVDCAESFRRPDYFSTWTDSGGMTPCLSMAAASSGDGEVTAACAAAMS